MYRCRMLPSLDVKMEILVNIYGYLYDIDTNELTLVVEDKGDMSDDQRRRIPEAGICVGSSSASLGSQYAN